MATRITEATVVQAVPPMFAPGSVLLERYQVEATLGVGGCSIVLRARDHVLDQAVALKILRGDVGFGRDMETRLLREARVIAQLSSPHVVRIFDVGMLDGAPFVVMELLHGADLCERLAQHGSLAPAVAVDFILQACDALGEAHARGIVHRDIKPSNLFVVTQSDGTELVKVLDFGISKSPLPDGDLSLTQTSALLGTPAYMAPEQLRSARAADARSDVWALGTVLYELVEGQLPLTAESFADLVIAATTQPHRPMVAARELGPIIARCLAKNPDDRYSNVAELAADLAGFTTRAIGLACGTLTTHPYAATAPAAASRVTLHARSPGTPPFAVPSAPPTRSLRRIALVATAAAAVILLTVMLAARARDRASAPRVDRAPATLAAPAVPAAPPAPPAPPVPTAPPAPAAPVAPVAPAAIDALPPATPPAAAHRDPAARPADHASPPTRPAVVRGSGPPAATTRHTSSETAAPPKAPRVHPATTGAGSGVRCDPYARPDGC